MRLGGRGLTAKHGCKATAIDKARAYSFPHPRYPLSLHRLSDHVDGTRELFGNMGGLHELELEFALDRLGRMGYRCTGHMGQLNTSWALNRFRVRQLTLSILRRLQLSCVPALIIAVPHRASTDHARQTRSS